MSLYKRLFFVIIAVAFSALSFAQSGTNSPYSQYGLGQLSEQSSGFNRGMNGLGLGFREHNQINHINRAIARLMLIMPTLNMLLQDSEPLSTWVLALVLFLSQT